MEGLVQAAIPEERQLEDGAGSFPLTFMPRNKKFVSATQLTAWCKGRSAELRAFAERHGAVLIRGCHIRTPEDFASVARALKCEDYAYIGGAAPRTELVPGLVWTAQDSPPDQAIPMHHTLAQAVEPPAYVLFHCEVPPAEGGATPLVPSAEVASFLESKFPAFAQRVAAQGVRYIRVMPEETDPSSSLGRSWKETYKVSTRAEAEEAMRSQGTTWTWLPNGDCRTVTGALPALRTDGRTGKRVFFNSVIAAFSGWNDSRNDGKSAVTLGDGSPVDAEALQAVSAFINERKVSFKWQLGDVLILDNTVVMHGQDTYKPPRRILASLRGPALETQGVEEALMDETLTSAPLRIGIIGAGVMGREHIRNIALLGEDVAHVTAVADPTEQSRKEALVDLGSRGSKVDFYESYADLLSANNVDGVIICAPNYRHIEVLRLAIASNKHILCEKPLCTKVEDCEEVERLLKERAEKASQEHGEDMRQGIFMTAMEYRWMPPIQKLIHETDSGNLGAVCTVMIKEHRFPFLQKVDNWNRFNRYTGGTLVEKACHFFDLMRRITQSEPVRVYASGGQAVNHTDEVVDGEQPDILDHAFVTVEFACGARCMLDLCMFAEDEQTEQVTTVCELGKVEAKAPESTVRVLKRKQVRGLGRAPPMPHTRAVAEMYKLPVPEALAEAGYHEGSVFSELSEFVAAAKGLRPVPVSARDGKVAVMMGLAAQESIATGHAVLLDTRDGKLKSPPPSRL